MLVGKYITSYVILPIEDISKFGALGLLRNAAVLFFSLIYSSLP